MKTDIIQAIERVLDKRQGRGATDLQLTGWLEAMKLGHQDDPHGIFVLNGFIDAIRQTPDAANYNI